MVLVAWGCRLYLPYINDATITMVKKWIKEKALHGPEGTYPKEGQYEIGLIDPAVPPKGSDRNDSVLCPT